jgi:hypothetical protein
MDSEHSRAVVTTPFIGSNSPPSKSSGGGDRPLLIQAGRQGILAMRIL